MRRGRRKGTNRDKVFGCDLQEHLTSTSQDVPQVLHSCSEFIEEYGIVDGIYRLSGVSSNTQKLRSEFDAEGTPDLYKDVYLQDIHCVSSLCKAYFRELPNPLLTYELYDRFADAVAIQLEDERLVKIKDVLKDLPAPHYRTLEYLMHHLVKMSTYSSQTNMHSRNLAIVWAPNLLRSKDIESTGFNGTAAFMEVRVQSIVVEFILTHVAELFPEPGLAKERRKSLPSPTLLAHQEEHFFKSLPLHCSGNLSPGDGPPPMRPYHAIIDGTDKRKSSLKGRKWRSIFNLGGRLHDPRKKSKYCPKDKEKTSLRPAKSMDSLSSGPFAVDDSKHPPALVLSSGHTEGVAAVGGGVSSGYAVTYRRTGGAQVSMVSGGTPGTYNRLDSGGGASGGEGLQVMSRSPGMTSKADRRAGIHISGPFSVTVPLHITSGLALGVLHGGWTEKEQSVQVHAEEDQTETEDDEVGDVKGDSESEKMSVDESKTDDDIKESKGDVDDQVECGKITTNEKDMLEERDTPSAEGEIKLDVTQEVEGDYMDMRGHLQKDLLISAHHRENDGFSEHDVQEAFGFLDLMDSCASNQEFSVEPPCYEEEDEEEEEKVESTSSPALSSPIQNLSNDISTPPFTNRPLSGKSHSLPYKSRPFMPALSLSSDEDYSPDDDSDKGSEYENMFCQSLPSSRDFHGLSWSGYDEDETHITVGQSDDTNLTTVTLTDDSGTAAGTSERFLNEEHLGGDSKMENLHMDGIKTEKSLSDDVKNNTHTMMREDLLQSTDSEEDTYFGPDPIPSSLEPIQTDTADMSGSNHNGPNQTDMIIISDQEPNQIDTAIISDQEPNQIDTTIISAQEPNQIDTAIISDQEPNQIDTAIISDQEPNQIDTTIISDQEPNQIDTAIISDQEPNQIDTTIISAQEPNQINTTIISDQEPNQIDTAIISDQEPNQIDTAIISDQEPNQIDTAIISDQEPNQIDTTIISVQEPNKIDTTVIGDQEPNQIDTTVIGDQEPNQIDTTIISVQEPNQIDTTVMCVQEPNQIDTAIISVQEPNQIDTAIIGDQEPNQIDTTVISDQEPNQIDTTVMCVQEPNQIDTAIISVQEPNQIDTTIICVQEPNQIDTAIISAQEPNQIDTTVMCVQEPNQIDTAIISDQEPNQIDTAIISDQEQNQIDTAIISDQEPNQIDTTIISDQEPNQIDTTVISDQEPNQIDTTTISDQEPNQIDTAIISDQEPNQIDTTVISDQEPNQIDTTIISDQEPNQINTAIISDQEPNQIDTTVISDQEPNQIDTTIISAQEPNQIHTTTISDQEPNQIDMTVMCVQEPNQIDTTVMCVQEPNQIDTSTISDQEPIQEQSSGVEVQQVLDTEVYTAIEIIVTDEDTENTSEPEEGKTEKVEKSEESIEVEETFKHNKHLMRNEKNLEEMDECGTNINKTIQDGKCEKVEEHVQDESEEKTEQERDKQNNETNVDRSDKNMKVNTDSSAHILEENTSCEEITEEKAEGVERSIFVPQSNKVSCDDEQENEKSQVISDEEALQKTEHSALKHVTGQVKSVPVVPPKPQRSKLTALSLRIQFEHRDAERQQRCSQLMDTDGQYDEQQHRDEFVKQEPTEEQHRDLCLKQDITEQRELIKQREDAKQHRTTLTETSVAGMAQEDGKKALGTGDGGIDFRKDLQKDVEREVKRNSGISICFDEAVARATVKRSRETSDRLSGAQWERESRRDGFKQKEKEEDGKTD